MEAKIQNMFYAPILMGFIGVIVFNIPKFLSYQKAQTKLLMMIVEQNNKDTINDNHKKILNDIIIKCELKEIKLYEVKKDSSVDQKN